MTKQYRRIKKHWLLEEWNAVFVAPNLDPKVDAGHTKNIEGCNVVMEFHPFYIRKRAGSIKACMIPPLGLFKSSLSTV